MKKIVYIVGGIYGVSGMSQVLTQKINWLAKNTDYKLYMVLTERPELPWAFDIDSSVSYVNFDVNFDELDTMPLLKKLWHYNSKQKKYRKLLTHYLIDLKADIVVSACRREINFINDIPDGSHKIGEIHFGRIYYRQFNKKWVPNMLCQLISKIWMNKFIHAVKKMDRFVVLSKEDSKNWPELSNLQVIPNPLKQIPTEFSNCMTKRVVAAGSYTHVKGFDLLLQAWIRVKEKHPDWRLDIFGNGNRHFYNRTAAEFNVDDVVTCHHSSANIYKEYINSSIFVLSSRHEGFGLVLAEAMCCGVPVVSFACPCGPREIISDGEDGILVEPENTNKLAEAICHLIENEESRKAMGAKAKLSALRFQEADIMKRWMKIFENIN